MHACMCVEAAVETTPKHAKSRKKASEMARDALIVEPEKKAKEGSLGTVLAGKRLGTMTKQSSPKT